MSKQRLAWLLWLLPLAVVAWYLLDRYVWISAEDEVRRFIQRGRRAAESLSILRCEPLLARNFATGTGMDRGTFLYFARTEFARLRELEVSITKTEINLAEDETAADVLLTLLISGTNRDGTRWRGIREGPSRLERITLQVDKQSGDWKAVYLSWEER